MRRRAATAACALAGGLLCVSPSGAAGAVTATHDEAVDAEVVATLQDRAIDESSGLVVRAGRLFTVNDSGDGPHVYEVSLRDGETISVTTFAEDDPEDVEALAPGRGESLWIGDIGDNRRARPSIEVYRLVPPAGGGQVPAGRYTLTYPDGPHDAEALLVHPRTGRLVVVTKSFTEGAGVYLAPRRLRPGASHELERVGRMPGLVTDGTFLGGGDRVLLRGYASAGVYSYPALERLSSFLLPAQEQGEAVALGDDGRIYLTSEGRGSDVLAFDLPAVGREAAPVPVPRPRTDPRPTYHPEPWMGLGPAGLLGAVAAGGLSLGLAWVGLRAVRRRGRRRR